MPRRPRRSRLQVAEPHLNGPGGDAPIILHDARTGTQQVICGQGVAPQAATLDTFRRPRARSDPRHRPAAGGGARRVRRMVPAAARLGHMGAVGRAGIRDRLRPQRHPHRAAHQRHDRRRAPAVRAGVEELGRRVPARRQGARAQRLFARPALAATYERICREAVGTSREARIDAARNAWYRGFVAEAVDRFFRSNEVLDVTGRRHRGLLTADDFARWSAGVEDAVAYEYRDHTVLEMRAVEPGAGAVAAARAAARLRRWRDGPDRCGVRAHGGRVRQARLC